MFSKGGGIPLAPATSSWRAATRHLAVSSATPSAGPQAPARKTMQGESLSHACMARTEPQGFLQRPGCRHPECETRRIQNRFICHPERSAKHEVEGSRTASWKLVCFEWHFARSHIHFVRVFALRNASSPQRNTRWALLGAVTAGYVCSAVTAQPL